ncbi:MAG: hypothetical protein E7Z84_01610 [Methanosphaera stadtmanae]|nr:hypothetical protein [Methanosphaera stadtmanae]
MVKDMTKQLRTNTVDFGIDLGTTTSIIAHVVGNDTEVIPNYTSNMNFTPSVVAEDKRGHIIVGNKAKNEYIRSSDNARGEFKLDMGVPKKYKFKRSGNEYSPEELSAEVLKELRNSVDKQINTKVNSVVITVPADFGPHQTQATIEAAKLAGFKNTSLIMEPVAAAYAYGKNASKEDEGIWLIYDFGGGTFDVSVVRLDGDEFNHVSHSGDEYLGGKLIDDALVDNILVKEVKNDLNISDFERSNNKYSKPFAKLKGAAEDAKKTLSTQNEADIFIETLLVNNDEIYDFEYTLTKEELKNTMDSFINRTINHCKDALSKASLTMDDVDSIILVGGSTLSPIIRDRLENEFNKPLKYNLDPVTVVAKGAAIYAGTLIDENNDIPPHEGSFGIDLDYNTTGPKDVEFFVFGTLLSDNVDDFTGFEIEVTNIKTETTTGKVPIEEDGYFEFELLPEDIENTYSIDVFDANGSLVEISENSPNAIIYKCDIAPPKDILPHTLGLGLADDTLFVLAKEGSPIPYDNMEIFKTSTDIVKGDSSTYVIVPLYNGTYEVASRNTKVGELKITGLDVDNNLDKGSEVALKVNIDESRIITIDVTIPELDQSFDCKIIPDLPSDIGVVKQKYQAAKDRMNELQSKCKQITNNAKINQYWKEIEDENILNDIDTFIKTAENDDAAINQADKRINDLNNKLDLIEKLLDSSNKPKQLQNLRDEAQEKINNLGDSPKKFELQQKLDRISDDVDEAVRNNDDYGLEKLQEELVEFIATEVEDPKELLKQLALYLIMEGEYKDEDLRIVNDLKQAGMKALAEDDFEMLVNVVQQLAELSTNIGGSGGFEIPGGLI